LANKMTENFLKELSKYQTEINKEFKIFFASEIKNSKTPFLKKTLKKLEEFSLRPGKRIRAILINYGYFLAGGKDKKNILKASISIELIHNFLLIHDDIIDRDIMRRGKASLHYQYQKESNLIEKEEKKHYGLSMAIAGGDMMYFLGHKILTQSKISNDYKIDAIKKLDQITTSTIYGEMFEIWLKQNFKNGEIIKEKDVLDILKNKTAFYTFVGPLQMGAMLAGGNQKTINFLEKIGISLGVAFQIKDDIQDLSTASDIKEGQPNLLIVKAINKAQGKIIKKYLNKKNIDKDEIKIIKKAMAESGAYEYCMQISRNLMTQAKKDIIQSKYPKKEKEFLLNLADYISERKI